MGFVQATCVTGSHRALFIAGVCAMAAACADLPKTSNLSTPPSLDPNSAIAKEVKSAGASKDPYPQFSRIPATPTDVRPTRAWSRSIYDSLRLRRQIMVETALFPPAPTDTAEFAASQRRTAAAPGAAAAQQGGSADTFVEAGRERATPPSSTR